MKNLKLVLSIIVGIALAFYMGTSVAVAFEHPEYATVISLILIGCGLIPKTKGSVAFEDLSPDLTAISRYAFKNKIALLRRYFNSMAIADDITLQPNVVNAMPLPMLVINGQPRPYTGNFRANAGDIAYTDRELTVEKFQRDFIIDPTKYANTYLANMRKAGSNPKNMDIPFAQFTVETAVGENAAQLNNKTAFFGLGKTPFVTFNPATAYTVGSRIKFTFADGEPHYYTCKTVTAAAETPLTHPAKWELSDALAITEGLGTKIKAGRTAGTVKAVATGATTSADGFDQALAVFRGLPQEVKDNAPEIFLYASGNTIEKIADSFKNDILKYTDKDGTLTVLPRTDGICKIKKATWMNGSDMMIASPKSNLFMGTDLLADFNDIKTLEQMYHLQMGISGVLGFQYADNQALSVNDQN
jgi:hypothetical protein